jgi:hypothetical protein
VIVAQSRRPRFGAIPPSQMLVRSAEAPGNQAWPRSSIYEARAVAAGLAVAIFFGSVAVVLSWP